MVTEEITLEGHIIDSLILSKVLDDILAYGADFRITEMRVGQTKDDRSFARVEVSADSPSALSEVISRIARHGAIVKTAEDVRLVPAEQDGVFPEGFYSTTNQRTCVRYQGNWHDVLDQEMDCGIVFDKATGQFRCVPVADIKAGDLVVVGYRGVKVTPAARGPKVGVFEFMSSAVSSEKPKNVAIKQIADRMRQVRASDKKILLVGGPAIVHTGSAHHVVQLIEKGYIDVLFAGNALAVHDIEQALYGTSLGVYMDRAIPAETGHEHHLRAINTIRRYGSIRAAIEAGVLTTGIMHAVIRHGVEFVLAGSIRDDGPLPEVITDTLVAQAAMRAHVRSVGFALMIATTLHSVATGNLLPADVPVVCVDINPAVATKLADRGSFQTVGLVTDVEPFLRELLAELDLA
ncbi:MAG TPA: TIGR00300 family protein [Phycisphaerae bacterium]|nr:TIGR00300 family protein [Phycisphaerae bacterium]HOJ75891.1 TIGR00300 family protein [Phycisphaerae bacterium]HOM52333.1 TIGR00300 family protein [Phycisphaerae bacterium]HON68745.1 TIGR00300 family protein [Phycisphaerae bacterium]HOQ87973.1 TIGR00300 family protein [Phycisphaerae bacterium]